MIDISQRRIFLHPSKTGGTSLEVALMKRALGLPAEDKLDNKAVRLFDIWDRRSKQHWPLDKILKVYPFLVRWKKFATIRHPYDRVISEFKYQIRGNRNYNVPGSYWDACDINGALTSGALWKAAWAWHGMPQVKYLSDDVEIIRYENFRKDVERVTGLKELPHLMKSPDGLSFELSDEAKDCIQSRFSDDFETLGYER
jgi:hypothetical protein